MRRRRKRPLTPHWGKATSTPVSNEDKGDVAGGGNGEANSSAPSLTSVHQKPVQGWKDLVSSNGVVDSESSLLKDEGQMIKGIIASVEGLDHVTVTASRDKWQLGVH